MPCAGGSRSRAWSSQQVSLARAAAADYYEAKRDRLRAFLSSTFADLAEYRALTTDALERLGARVSRVEISGVKPAEAAVHSLDEVANCDLFVGIYAHRYGCVPPGDELSITEQEFDQARRLAKPILCFVVHQNFLWPSQFIEAEPGRTRLTQFKEKLGKSVPVVSFTTPQDLLSLVTNRLSGNYLNSICGFMGEAR